MGVQNTAATRPVSRAQANHPACRPRWPSHPTHARLTAGPAYLGTPEGAGVALSIRQARPRPRVGALLYAGRVILSHCPTCGDRVLSNHRCPGRTIDPPAPRPANFWDLVEEARREAQAEARQAAVIQEELPLSVPPVSSAHE